MVPNQEHFMKENHEQIEEELNEFKNYTEESNDMNSNRNIFDLRLNNTINYSDDENEESKNGERPPYKKIKNNTQEILQMLQDKEKDQAILDEMHYNQTMGPYAGYTSGTSLSRNSWAEMEAKFDKKRYQKQFEIDQIKDQEFMQKLHYQNKNKLETIVEQPFSEIMYQKDDKVVKKEKGREKVIHKLDESIDINTWNEIQHQFEIFDNASYLDNEVINKYTSFMKKYNTCLYKKFSPTLANKVKLALHLTFPWGMTKLGFNWLVTQFETWLCARTNNPATKKWKFNYDIVSWIAICEQGKKPADNSKPYHCHMVIIFDHYMQFVSLIGSAKPEMTCIQAFFTHLEKNYKLGSDIGEEINLPVGQKHNISYTGYNNLLAPLDYIFKTFSIAAEEVPCYIRIAKDRFGCAQLFIETWKEDDTEILSQVHQKASNKLETTTLAVFNAMQAQAINGPLQDVKDVELDISQFPPKFNINDPVCQKIMQEQPVAIVLEFIRRTDLGYFIKNSQLLNRYLSDYNTVKRMSALSYLKNFVYKEEEWFIKHTATNSKGIEKVYQGVKDRLENTEDFGNDRKIIDIFKLGVDTFWKFFDYCFYNLFVDPVKHKLSTKGGFFFLTGIPNCGKTYWIQVLLHSLLPGLDYHVVNGFNSSYNTWGKPAKPDNIYYLFRDEINSSKINKDLSPETIKNFASSNFLNFNIKYSGIQLSDKIGQFYISNYNDDTIFCIEGTDILAPGIKERMWRVNLDDTTLNNGQIFPFSKEYISNFTNKKAMCKLIWSYVFYEHYVPKWQAEDALVEEFSDGEDPLFNDL